MSKLKYTVGDKVRIKPLDWYNENKDKRGFICFDYANFIPEMTKYCGEILTIKQVVKDFKHYFMLESGFVWTDEMIECQVGGFVEEETKFGTASNPLEIKSNANCLIQGKIDETKPEPKFKVGDILFYRGETCGYLKVEEIREENGEIRYYETSRNLYLVENHPEIFVDKVCSVETEETKPIDFTIKTTDTKGKVEVVIPDGYGYEIENDKLYFITKKREYPKTYEECSVINGCEGRISLSIIGTFTKLINARNAYWRIAGKEMGLGKPWEPTPDTFQTIYIIRHTKNNGKEGWDKDKIDNTRFRYILSFPTEEMRDAFYENFKEDIEKCKELL